MSKMITSSSRPGGMWGSIESTRSSLGSITASPAPRRRSAAGEGDGESCLPGARGPVERDVLEPLRAVDDVGQVDEERTAARAAQGEARGTPIQALQAPPPTRLKAGQATKDEARDEYHLEGLRAGAEGEEGKSRRGRGPRRSRPGSRPAAEPGSRAVSCPGSDESRPVYDNPGEHDDACLNRYQADQVAKSVDEGRRTGWQAPLRHPARQGGEGSYPSSITWDTFQTCWLCEELQRSRARDSETPEGVGYPGWLLIARVVPAGLRVWADSEGDVTSGGQVPADDRKHHDHE